MGRLAGRKTVACITDMDQPPGERGRQRAGRVREALALLKGEYHGELEELCLTLGSCILTGAGAARDEAEARAKLERGIADGSALEKFAEFIEAQGGDRRAVYDGALLPDAPVKYEAKSEAGGYVQHIDAEGVGLVSMHLGRRGARPPRAGLTSRSASSCIKNAGDFVAPGESLATIHARSRESAVSAAELLRRAYTIGSDRPNDVPFVKAIIRAED